MKPELTQAARAMKRATGILIPLLGLIATAVWIVLGGPPETAGA